MPYVSICEAKCSSQISFKNASENKMVLTILARSCDRKLRVIIIYGIEVCKIEQKSK